MCCASYRPISLLNLDAQLYAKVLATKLLPLLLSWIALGQTDSIPGRENRESSHRTLSLIAHVCKNSQSTLFLSSDAEKAFDRAGLYSGHIDILA